MGNSRIAKGPAGGQVHLLTAAYRLAEPAWCIGDHVYKPLLELPLTLALPQYPQHQLTMCTMHQSGGEMFDRGGVNNFGTGYRLGF